MTNRYPTFLQIYGSGASRAQWYIDHMPDHTAYGEPFAGGLNVLVQKPQCEYEIASDLNGRLMNCMNVLRTQPEALFRLIELTPWHDGERLLAKEQSPDALEDARRVWCGINMSIVGNTNFDINGGFKWSRSPMNPNTKNFTVQARNMSRFYAFADRIKNVQFLIMDALTLLKIMSGKGFFIYVDPPYFSTDRARKKAYSHEQDQGFHEQLVQELLRFDGKVMLSGYQTPVYTPLETAGWRRIDHNMTTNSGGNKTESIWLNYETKKQRSMFDL
jgi:DNA adenine methylase